MKNSSAWQMTGFHLMSNGKCEGTLRKKLLKISGYETNVNARSECSGDCGTNYNV